MKKRIDLSGVKVVHHKTVVKTFEQFLRTIQKSNCSMMTLHGLTVYDIFLADREKFPDKWRARVSASIMKLMRVITETRPGSSIFQLTQLMLIDMDRCVLVDES